LAVIIKGNKSFYEQYKSAILDLV